MKQITKREIENFAAEVTAVVNALPRLLPVTTTVAGVPDLVWDANDEILMMEVVL